MTAAECGMSGRDMLPADVAELLTAVLEALDMPLPSNEDGDDRKYYRLLERRTSGVRVALRSLLAYPDYLDLPGDAAYIRKYTAEHPVTYTPFVSSRTGEAG
ncbi:hypothetical protein [Streptomyces sp. NPDC058872]|uniref:hypothetical protein n=1 Tax=Streptomyces sp. NPDC058872 TaxID=3346661 RepID=UPI0036A61722